MSNAILTIENLSKRFDSFMLDNVSIEVPAGCIVGFVGANGAGKTTTLKCIMGIMRPDQGSIELFGEQVALDAEGFVGEKRFAQLRQDVGFVPDTCPFPVSCSIETVGDICSRVYENWDAAQFDRLTVEYKLAKDKKVEELSRGMGMKLSLACALAHSPKLLVLDEATAGLDPLAREELLEALRDYVAQEECGVLMSSHITSDLERIADSIVCIGNGRIAFDMAIDEITDIAGIAHCRAAEFEELIASGAYEPGELRIRKGTYGTDVLVPNRFEFAEAFPEIAIDRASIDEYLFLTLKGEQL